MSERIAIFLPNLSGGGAERMMVNLARGFTEAGHRVDLVLSTAVGAYLNEVPETVDIVDLDASEYPGYAAMGSLRALVGFLRSTEPDAMVSAMTRANIVTVLASILARTATTTVVSERTHLSSFILSESAAWRLMPWLVRASYPRADGIVPISEGVADDLADSCGLDRGAMDVIYNPVVTPELFDLADEPIECEWLNDPDVLTVVGVGRLAPEKDFPTLLGAFATLRTDRRAKLVILGEGPEKGAIERESRRLGIEEDVFLPGFVDNPYAYMRRADVFALSSISEGFGNVLVEAMACGTPVVSTDCPSGPAEILADGRYGTLVPVGDHEALATAIEETLKQPPDQDVLVQRAREFSYDVIADQYLDILLR